MPSSTAAYLGASAHPAPTRPRPTDGQPPPGRWQAGVLTMREAQLAGHSRGQIRRRIEEGRWQLYSVDVLITQPGPPTAIQRMWCALVSIGPDALLGGASAAALGGLRGFDDPTLTVLLASGRRVTQRPGVWVRGTARLDPHDVSADNWPPRTTLPRSLVDLAEWATAHDDARTVLAVAVASGIVETAEIRAALARRGPIARRQVIGDALDDLDAAARWVPDLLYRRVEARFQLTTGSRATFDPRCPDRLTIRHDRWQVRVEIDPAWGGTIRTASELPPSAGGRAGKGPLTPRVFGQPVVPASDIVLRVPSTVLREEPDRVGGAVATILRQRGWRPPLPRPASSDLEEPEEFRPPGEA